MINSLSLERFKQIEIDTTIPLAKINVIIGANNAGKSTLMQAIQFLTSVCQSLGGARNTTFSAQQLIYIPVTDMYALATNWRITQTEGFKIAVDLENYGQVTMQVFRGKNQNISIKFGTVSQEIQELLSNLETPFSMYVPGLAGIAPFETYKTPSIVRKAVAKGDANNYFRNILLQLSEKETDWNNFLEDFTYFFQDYDIEIEFNPYVDEYIEVYIYRNGQLLPIDSSGAGMLQAIQILAYIHLFKPKILLLDEPDSHLHPNNQRLLATVIENILERGVNVVIATHSRHMLDNFFENSDARIIWARNGVFNIVERDDIPVFEILSEIGAIDGIDKLLLRDKKCIVFTEDEDVLPIKTILESSNFLIDDIVLWSYKGCTKIDTAITLAQFTHQYNPNIKIVVHRDRDYMNDEESREFKERLLGHGIMCFLTDGVDAESYFVSTEHLENIFELPTIICEEIVSQAIDHIQDISIDKIAAAKQYADRSQRITALMPEARRLYSSNKQRYFYGKKAVKRMKVLLQENGITSVRDTDIFVSSTAVSSEVLQSFAAEIWTE